jgi:regulator of sigma E protease
VIFTCLFTFFGKPSTTARVDKVEAGSAAAAAGFQVGDVVTAIDGKTDRKLLRHAAHRQHSRRRATDLHHQARRFHAAIAGTPELKEVKDPSEMCTGSACSASPARRRRRCRDRAGGSRDRAVARRQGNLVRGRPDAGLYRRRLHRPRSGRPGRRSAADRPDFGQVATIGVAALVHLAAVLSISIGLLNLFPVPLLDGGHLLFYAVEAVRGRPLSERAQEMGFRIGLGLVLMLMVFATYNDILHLAAS